MASPKTIELKKGEAGEAVQFTLPHALNLLRLQAKQRRNDWMIVDTKKWQFEDNEISRRQSSNRGSQEA